MDYQAELTYTLKDFRQFEKVHQKLRTKSLYVLAKILMAAATGMLVFLLVFATVRGLWQTDLAPYILLLLVMFPFYFLLKEVRVRAALKAANAQGPVRIRADETGVHAEAKGISSDFAYTAYCNLAYCRGTWYLYLNKRQAQILPERCFTQGDPAAFGAFIAEKTGLEVKEIK